MFIEKLEKEKYNVGMSFGGLLSDFCYKSGLRTNVLKATNRGHSRFRI